MLNLALYSDLHIEMQKIAMTKFDENLDVLVLAGDIHRIDKIARLMSQLAQQNPHLDIVYVAGNHEFYGCNHMLFAEQILRKQLDAIERVHFLQCDTKMIKGVRFLGCTGWSRFRCLGERYSENHLHDIVGKHINDFHVIKMGSRSFSTKDCVSLGNLQYQWLEDNLSNQVNEPTVVVTHFSPSVQCGNENFDISPITAYFCNDYDELIERYKPEYWLYGHTHFNLDKNIASTRVITNQHGYGSECPDFESDINIEITKRLI